MSRKVLLGLAMLLFLFSFESAWAFPVGGTPNLLISSAGQGPGDVTPYGTTTDRVILGDVTSNTDSPMSYSTSGTGYTQNSSANPLAFQVNSAISASGTTWATVDGVATWFVVNGGTPGSTVSLTTDIGFQGQISGLGLTSGGAYFTNYLGFVSSTSSTQYSYIIVQNGAVVANPVTNPPKEGTVGTVPDMFLSTGTYTINEVIRSIPFEVTVGTPFRLALVLNSTVVADGGTETASVDWDPGFSNFFKDGAFALADGTPLGQAGYDLEAVNVPIPPAFLLLGSGLAALVGFRRKLQRS